MIDVNYNRKDYTVSVTGHAQSGEAGHDLVCSAVSILVYTLASNVERMSQDSSRFHKAKIKVQSGEAKIQCRPINGMKAVASLVMDSICTGFDILSQKYPDNVRYQVQG